jgi:hypothetical protein
VSKKVSVTYPPSGREQHRTLGLLVDWLRDKGLNNDETREYVERKTGGDIDPTDWAETMLDTEAYEGSQYR